MSLPTAQTVEIEWDGVSFTDVTTWLEQRYPVEAHFGRMAPTGDIETANLTFTLDNRDGRFTPGNPAGAYWPNVVKGKRVRWKVTGGDGVTRTEYVGYIQSFEPGFDDGGVSGAVVTVTAADRLAQVTRPFLDNAVEAQRYEVTTLPGNADIWPLDDRDGSTTLRNVGVQDPFGAALQPGRLVPPSRSGTSTANQGGTATFGSPDGSIAVGAMLSLAPSGGVGTVLQLQTSTASSNSLQWWYQTTEVPATYTIAARGYDYGFNLVWELRFTPSGGQTNLELFDNVGVSQGVVDYGVNDGMWRHVWVDASAGLSMQVWVAGADQQVNTYTSWIGVIGLAADFTRYLILGGGMSPRGQGLQHHCATMNVAQPMVSELTAFGYATSSVPRGSRAVSARVSDYSKAVFGSGGVITVNGSDDRRVGLPDVAGNTLTQVLQEIARTVGGVAWVKPDGTVEFRQPDACRPLTVGVSVDVEADAEGPPALAAGVDTRPTRTTATSPAGDVTVVRADEGATVVEDSFDTCALDTAQATHAGELRLVAGQVLRIPQITVNLASATADLWDEMYALYPTARVRVSGLASRVLGWSHLDYHVQGWTKRAVVSADGGSDGFWVDLDLEPAVDEAAYDTGRWAADGAMTATAGTITGTSTGTLVITTVSGPTLSTDPGDYPLDLDWNGERVTVTAAPGSTVSPQTVTVTARGVAPSVARTHGAAEPVDAYDAARWAM